jgi:hypothetical protein
MEWLDLVPDNWSEDCCAVSLIGEYFPAYDFAALGAHIWTFSGEIGAEIGIVPWDLGEWGQSFLGHSGE